MPARTVAAGGGAQNLTVGRDVAGAWWTLLGSPDITALVTRAVARNPSLEQERQTLRQAQETTLAAEGAWLPSLTGQLYRQRNQYSYAQSGAPGSARSFSLYGARLNVAYTFDVWGQSRRTVDHDRSQAEAQSFTYLGAANMLAASVGGLASQAADLFTLGTGVRSLTNQALAPIFQGGTLLHQERAARAQTEAAAAAWRNTVVTAFQNLADALTAVTVDAEVQYQNAVIALLRARATRLADSAALFAALGGGWWNRTDLPPPPEPLLRSLLP